MSNRIVQTPVRKTFNKNKKIEEELPEDISLLQTSSYETKLRRFGYQPETRIILNRTSGCKSIYYKARSPMGFHVYVEINNDEDGKLSFNNNLVMEEVTTGKSLDIPHSIKQGVFEDTGEAAIVCSNGMCRVGRKYNSTDMEESNYTFRSFHTDAMIQDNKSIIAYPVVKLGEIEASPEEVLNETSKIMARIRRSAYMRIGSSIETYKNELMNNRKHFSTFLIKQREIAESLAASMKELHMYQKKSIENPPKSEKESLFSKQADLNLRRKNDQSTLFLELSSEIEKLTTDLSKITQHFQNIIATFDDEFSDVSVFNTKQT
jgi:hypothetical protein